MKLPTCIDFKVFLPTVFTILFLGSSVTSGTYLFSFLILLLLPTCPDFKVFLPTVFTTLFLGSSVISGTYIFSFLILLLFPHCSLVTANILSLMLLTMSIITVGIVVGVGRLKR